MNPIETISDRRGGLCMIVRGSFAPEATTFVTPPEAPLQLGYVVRGAGESVPRHRHRPVPRAVVGTPEVIVVRRGGCYVDLFDEDSEPVATRELRAGDVAVFMRGGHGFRMTEDTELIEVKQGPYSGANDKVCF